ncbi:MAG: SDR family oxidoreductase [Deltaproteobacteria bacterium]|uniref:SDR family oxidoreductase n=1 Tax=Candidatus Zymogenus saltonus TaxID=2844893 RepID=A0A9D8PJ64_9DELT|nr:SDR family oxidoreductase [Candidatus Zymogenus saltonus]
MTNPFKDKVAVVTGAASGIGRAISNELVRMGATVIAADINLEGAKETASSIAEMGAKTAAKKVDVTKHDQVKQLIADVVKEQGRLDYIFNNAGIAFLGETRDMDISQWRQIIDVNMMGVLYGTLEAYPVMIKQGSGHIVNTASLAGLVPVPTETAYVTTKFAVVGLSASLRSEAKGLGVKVSVVCPGFVDTAIIRGFIPVNIRKEDHLKKMPRMMDVNKAARKILKRVRRNRSIILIGTDAHIIYFLQRYVPFVLNPLYLMMVKFLRTTRIED